MSKKKFIEIKFLYFLKPNSCLVFFSFSQSGKTKNLPSQNQTCPFRYSRLWKGKVTFSDIPCIILSTLKFKTTQTWLFLESAETAVEWPRDAPRSCSTRANLAEAGKKSH